jgi:hypothetical protein
MRFHKLTLIVGDDRRLDLPLPEDFPTGPAELILLALPAATPTAVAPTSTPPPEPRPSILDELRSRLRTGREIPGRDELDAIRLRRKRASARWQGSIRAGGGKRKSPGRG